MAGESDLQAKLLERLRQNGAVVAVWLVSGKRLIGRLRGYDRYTIVLDHGGAEHVVFKHAIATIGPARGD
ncbi:MAG: RNA chaperone Hfq [Acidobacteria bacterium]|nr:MAG: RNA chaperone Hfq [Acidobacteriota bacterium]